MSTLDADATDADTTDEAAAERSGSVPSASGSHPGCERQRTQAAPVRRVVTNARAIERQNVDRAIRRLEATGEVTDAQRETVEALADALVAEILEDPVRALAAAAAADDGETVATGTSLLLGE